MAIGDNEASYRKSSAHRIRAFLLGTAAMALAGGFGAPTLAQAQSGASGSAVAPSQGLEEIVVTAEKRADSIQNVPASVQAISGDRLQALNVTSLTDLTGFVPSLTLSSYGAPGTRTLVIRGLNDGYVSGFAGPLVAMYVDGLAVGSSTSAGRGAAFGLDLMPYDIDHVEVLEGPQGTLYGANAMGGLINYTLKQPTLNKFSGVVGGDVAHEDNSNSVDYEARAAVNIPLIADQLAMRVSAFHKSNAGYIDNIGISKTDSNSSNESGGRVSVLWAPTDEFTVKANVLLQEASSADSTNVELNGSTLQPLFGRYTTNTRFAQPSYQKFADYSLGGSYDFSFATLSSTVSYSQLRTSVDQDVTDPYGGYVSLFLPTVTGALALYQVRDAVSKVNEETRLTSSDQGRFSWIIGQYYTREWATENAPIPTYTSSNVLLPAKDYVETINQGSVYKEISMFGDITYKLTDSFDLTGGARWTHYDQDNNYATYGLFGSGQKPLGILTGNAETWMGNARYHIDADQMVYFRVATGFRPGSPNAPFPGVPAESSSDTSTDYEIGYKSSLLQNKIQITATAFHIEWNNIQEQATTPLKFAYITNSAGATSDGLEFSANYRITPELTLGVNTAFTNARLTADAPLVKGIKGDQLPLSPKFDGSATIDYARHIDDEFTFIAGVAYKHRDTVVNQFAGTGDPVRFGAQDIVDAYTGTTFGAYTARLYAKNIFNNQSYTGLRYLWDPAKPEAVPVQPQTFGLSFDYRF